MLQFSECFAIAKQLEPHIRANAALSQSRPASNIRVVGQEHHSALLIYAYDAFPATAKADSDGRTYVAAFDLDREIHTPLYTHHHVTRVVSASVNREVTLLAFTTLTAFAVQGGNFEDEYESFVVEVQPLRPEVFNLNVPRSFYQHVQFLRKDDSGRETSRLSHLLLFRHKEAIDLYTIQTNTDGKGITTITSPSLLGQTVAQRFVWFQWDAARQSVFYLHLRPTTDNTLGYETVLKCLQFPKGRSELKLDLPLRMEHIWAKFGEGEQTVAGNTYANYPCANTVYFSNFNMQVVHMGHGGICVCVQHATKRPAGAEAGNLAYTVFALHHTCAIEYSVPVPQPHANLAAVRLNFSCLNDYVMVYAPGIVLQLVDCGAQHEACHHISLLGHDVPALPNSVVVDDLAPLTYFDLAKQRALRPVNGPALFDVNAGVAYRVTINPAFLMECIRDGSTPALTLVIKIIHMCTIHLSDPELARRILHFVCTTCPHRLHVDVLKEYLTGNTYLNMQSVSLGEVEGLFLRLVPATTITSYYQEIHGGAGGNLYNANNIVPYVYSRMDSESLHVGTVGKSIQNGAYAFLHVQPTEWNVSRFVLEDIPRESTNPMVATGAALPAAGPGSTAPMPPSLPPPAPAEDTVSRSGGFFKRFGSTKAAPSPRKADGGAPPPAGSVAPAPFAQKSDIDSLSVKQDANAATPAVDTAVITALASHLLAATNKPADMCMPWAVKFRSCQFLQTTEIFRLLQTVRAPAAGKDSEPSTTQMRGGDQAVGHSPETQQLLFELFEKLYCVLQEVNYQWPLGFPNYFATLAYLCSPRKTFKTYVNAGVLQVTEDFVARMLNHTDHADDDDMNFFLVSKLPLASIQKIYKTWGHPACERFVAERMAVELLQQHEAYKRSSDYVPPEEGNDEVMQSDHQRFPPLRAFMSQLAQADEELGIKSPLRTARGTVMSLGFIEDTAMLVSAGSRSTQAVRPGGATSTDVLDVSF